MQPIIVVLIQCLLAALVRLRLMPDVLTQALERARSFVMAFGVLIMPFLGAWPPGSANHL